MAVQSSSDASQRLTLEPIGFVRCALESKAEAARQPPAAAGAKGRIELLSGRNFEHALDDLVGWEFIWVIFWFHLNPAWRPKVLPPRSTSGRKGVFSTRSPHRPNALGLSAVRLAIKAWRVHFTASDREVRVLNISSGYRAAQLAAATVEQEPFKTHREFIAQSMGNL